MEGEDGRRREKTGEEGRRWLRIPEIGDFLAWHQIGFYLRNNLKYKH